MIRFTNTRTGKSVAAKDGRDLATMLKIEQDRRSGMAVQQECGGGTGVGIAGPDGKVKPL